MSSIFLAANSLSFFFFSIANYLSFFFFSAAALAYFLYSYSSFYYFSFNSLAVSPEPVIASAFNSNSSVAYKTANAAVASLVSRLLSSLTAANRYFYLSLNSFDCMYFLVNSASALFCSAINIFAIAF